MSKLPSERIKEIHKNLIEIDPIGELMNIGGPSDAALKAIMTYLDETSEQKQSELQKIVQVPSVMPSNIQNGEWCKACGVWKQYGIPDLHHCTGYKVTC